MIRDFSTPAKMPPKQWWQNGNPRLPREGDTYDERITITPQPQSSITIMDQKTGQIKAMVGGRGEKASSLGLNRAYQGSKRQPGSTFKILAAYAPALDSCDKTLATTIDDEPYTLKERTGFAKCQQAVRRYYNSP